MTLLHDWDNVRAFLAVAKWGTFRAAAKDMSQSVNKVRRAVTALEESLGRRLLERDQTGISLTQAGFEALIAAERMAAAYLDMGAPSQQLRMEFGRRATSAHVGGDIQ